MTSQKPRERVNSGSLTVLVVDDHLLLAETLVSVLEAQLGCVVDTARDVEGALTAVERKGTYDVILLDYEVPGMGSLDGMHSLIAANNGRVAIFSGVINWIMVERALDEGAAGFLPKTMPLKTLGNAIRFIAEGEVFVPSDYLRRVSGNSDNGFGLKSREMKVLAFLCEGMQNKEIGRLLEIDEAIVKMDVKSICRKFGVRNRTQAVISARTYGIL